MNQFNRAVLFKYTLIIKTLITTMYLAISKDFTSYTNPKISSETIENIVYSVLCINFSLFVFDRIKEDIVAIYPFESFAVFYCAFIFNIGIWKAISVALNLLNVIFYKIKTLAEKSDKVNKIINEIVLSTAISKNIIRLGAKLTIVTLGLIVGVIIVGYNKYELVSIVGLVLITFSIQLLFPNRYKTKSAQVEPTSTCK